MLLIQKALISGIFFIVIPFIIGNGMTYRMRIQSIGMGCVFGWVIIKHPWSLTFKQFYIEYQPWITLIYIAIFVGPILGFLLTLI